MNPKNRVTRFLNPRQTPVAATRHLPIGLNVETTTYM